MYLQLDLADHRLMLRIKVKKYNVDNSIHSSENHPIENLTFDNQVEYVQEYNEH